MNMQGWVMLHGGGFVPQGTRVQVFQEIFRVFLLLGTAVGVVVISYMLYNAYKYRDRSTAVGTGVDSGRSESRDDDVGVDDASDRPSLGELPRGSGGDRKLLFSFSLSAIIVVSLILWTYGTLLYVENQPAATDGDALVVHVEGYQFGWRFIYPNGYTSNTLNVPVDRPVRLVVTSTDVFHNFGIPAFRVKTDAIPGQTTETWFTPERTGQYRAHCYELCGVGHSYMTASVKVMDKQAFDEWYAGTSGDGGNSTAGEQSRTANGTATENALMTEAVR